MEQIRPQLLMQGQAGGVQNAELAQLYDREGNPLSRGKKTGAVIPLQTIAARHTEPSIQQRVEQLQRQFPFWRGIAGDGNCCYRAVGFACLEQLLLRQELNRFLNQVAGLNGAYFLEITDTRIPIDEQLRAQFIAQLQQLMSDANPADTLEAWVKDDINNFDTALICFLRCLLLQAVDRHRELTDFMDQGERKRVMATYGANIEGLALGLLPVVLGIDVDIQVIGSQNPAAGSNSMASLQQAAAQFKQQIDTIRQICPALANACLGWSVFILIKGNGHYDIIYPAPMPLANLAGQQPGQGNEVGRLMQENQQLQAMLQQMQAQIMQLNTDLTSMTIERDNLLSLLQEQNSFGGNWKQQQAALPFPQPVPMQSFEQEGQKRFPSIQPVWMPNPIDFWLQALAVLEVQLPVEIDSIENVFGPLMTDLNEERRQGIMRDRSELKEWIKKNKSKMANELFKCGTSTPRRCISAIDFIIWVLDQQDVNPFSWFRSMMPAGMPWSQTMGWIQANCEDISRSIFDRPSAGPHRAVQKGQRALATTRAIIELLKTTPQARFLTYLQNRFHFEDPDRSRILTFPSTLAVDQFLATEMLSLESACSITYQKLGETQHDDMAVIVWMEEEKIACQFYVKHSLNFWVQQKSQAGEVAQDTLKKPLTPPMQADLM